MGMMTEVEEKEQEIGTLSENTVKENFPNLSKEMNMQVQEGQRVPNKLYPKRNTPRLIIITLPKIKNKERILKAIREKELLAGEFPQDCQLISQNKLYRK